MSTKTIKLPQIPFVVGTSISVITETTTKEQARRWLLELDLAYNNHFGPDAQMWTFDDIHEFDRDAMTELEAICGVSENFPLVTDLISCFRDPNWRRLYNIEDSSKSREYQFSVWVNDVEFMRGDKHSIGVIFGCLDGRNFEDNGIKFQTHDEWLRYMADEFDTVLDLGLPIKALDPEGALLQAGTIGKTIAEAIEN